MRSEDDDAPPARCTDATVKPVFFHARAAYVWAEVLYDVEGGYVIDLATRDGTVALAAIHAGIPYTSVALTDARAKHLRKHIHNAAFRAAAGEGDKLYDPEIVLSLCGVSR